VFCVVHAEEVNIRESRAEHLLDFDITYVLPVQLDIETLVDFPEGYIPTFVLAGSDQLISAEVVQKTVYIAKATREKFTETSLTIHVQCPDGKNKKLLFKIVGNTNIKVYGLQFQEQGWNELNQAIIEVQSRYNKQLAATLSQEEKRVSKQSFETTIKSIMPFFVKKHRRGISVREKGAVAWIEGVLSSNDETYIYVSSNVRNGSCDIVALQSVSLRNKKSSIPCELTHTQDIQDGFLYIYRTAPFPLSLGNKVKKTKVIFNFKMWSKNKSAKCQIS